MWASPKACQALFLALVYAVTGPRLTLGNALLLEIPRDTTERYDSRPEYRTANLYVFHRLRLVHEFLRGRSRKLACTFVRSEISLFTNHRFFAMLQYALNVVHKSTCEVPWDISF